MARRQKIKPKKNIFNYIFSNGFKNPFSILAHELHITARDATRVLAKLPLKFYDMLNMKTDAHHYLPYKLDRIVQAHVDRKLPR